jgi:hypothetical protein
LGSLSLPSPYPDELIVSVLARALIHNGLAPKRLLTRLVGVSHRSNYPAFLPTNLPEIADQTRVDAKTLLWRHTVFPYAVAFMPATEVSRYEQKVLGGCPAEKGSTASLVKSVTHGLPEYRFCTQCTREDLAARGESYWHRSHCFPGIHVCAIHGLPLQGTGERPRTFAQQLQMPLPHRQGNGSNPPFCSPDILMRVAKTTAAICSDSWGHHGEWRSLYRMRATDLQLTRSNGLLAGARIAFELRETLGADYLLSTGCGYTNIRSPWPTLMVRERSPGPFATVKHILMNAFLQHPHSRSSTFSYQRPGKAPHDAIRMDPWLAMQVQERAKAAIQRKEVITIRRLFEDTEKWQLFRHNRSAFPLTAAQVEAFKRSDASERKSGGKDAHAKKLQAIAEGRQKPSVYAYRQRKCK